MKNKRGGVGDIIMQFVAFIVIAIILAVFIMISGVWAAIWGEPAGMIYFGEDKSEESLMVYMSDGYESLNEVKFVVAGEKSVGEAIEEVGYDEK